MAVAVPKVLILGHSFVKRLQCDLKASFDARVDSSSHLEGTVMASLFGVGSRTVQKLRQYDLHMARRLAPDVVILEIGTSDLSVLGPEVIGSSIEELVRSLLDDFSVSVIGVCHVIPCGISFTHSASFFQCAKILNNYVSVILEPFPNVFCWSHKDFSSLHKDLYLADGVHVNSLGQHFLYRSYRGTILKALGPLRP